MTLGALDSVAVPWLAYTQRHPEDSQGFERLAEAYTVANVSDPRIDDAYDKCLRLFPGNLRARQRYALRCSEVGALLVSRSRFSEAESLYLKSLGLDSTSARSYNLLGELHATTGDTARAIWCYEKSISLASDDKRPYLNLGELYLEKLDLRRAEKLFLKVIEIDPAVARAYDDMAQVYYIGNDHDRTVEMLRKAARLGSVEAQRTLREGGVPW